MRVLYFGTYERGYPRNSLVIDALRSLGAEVVERHVDIWSGREHKYDVGVAALARVAKAEIKLATRLREPFDVVVVGYPGQIDMPAARLVARRKPIVFNPLVSFFDTLVEDRRRFGPTSAAARGLRFIDRSAFRLADIVVADTAENGRFFAQLGGLPPDRVAICFLGADEALFSRPWVPEEPFTALFVGKPAPLHGVDVILAAAEAAPDVRFRLVGSGQMDDVLAGAPANVEWIRWVEHELLPSEYARAGCSLGIFGVSAKARRVIPNKVFEALAQGVPVVTADTPASRELLEDGVNAVLTPPGDAPALARAIRSLRDDSAAAQRIGAAGRTTFSERAGRSVLAAAWRDVVERAVRRRVRA